MAAPEWHQSHIETQRLTEAEMNIIVSRTKQRFILVRNSPGNTFSSETIDLHEYGCLILFFFSLSLS